jgi:hypothetical protein
MADSTGSTRTWYTEAEALAAAGSVGGTVIPIRGSAVR